MDPSFHVPARRVIGLLVGAAVLLWFARPVLAPFVVGAFIAYAFTPFIDRAQARTGRSRLLIVVVGYLLGLIAIGAVLFVFAGLVYRELELLVQSGPNALTTALRQLLGSDTITIGDRTITVQELAVRLQAAIAAFTQTPETALRTAEEVLHTVLNIILTMIVTFYLLLDGNNFGNVALRFLDPSDRAQTKRIAGRIHVVLGHWLRGQLVLVVFVALVVSIVLGPILHLPYATGLGVMTGLLEVIPLIGPLIAGVIVAIVALSAGGVPLAITVVVFLFVLRQVEDIVVMPNVIGRAVHLHPLVAMFTVVVGTTAFGILGTFLAVPVAAAINVAMHEFFPAELGVLPDDLVAVDAGRATGLPPPPGDEPGGH
ncbi:MAG: AI-2E family transporter [Candidatus Limnocylindrales bacterium]